MPRTARGYSPGGSLYRPFLDAAWVALKLNRRRRLHRRAGLHGLQHDLRPLDKHGALRFVEHTTEGSESGVKRLSRGVTKGFLMDALGRAQGKIEAARLILVPVLLRDPWPVLPRPGPRGLGRWDRARCP